MVWAGTDIIPTTQTINAVFSVSANEFLDSVVMSTANVTSSNAKFDFTAATGAEIYCNAYNNLPAAFQSPTLDNSLVPTTHTSTGLTQLLTAAVLQSLIFVGCSLNLPFTYTVTDGTTNLLVCTGQIVCRVVP